MTTVATKADKGPYQGTSSYVSDRVPLMSNDTLRAEIADRICTITFTRAEQYNTITLAMRDELAATLDEANANDDVRVILIRAEGPAFCAGYGLDWAIETQAREESWDSVSDLRALQPFVDTFMKLWYSPKPTIAAVQGWCIAGGTDMVLCADIIVASDDAIFGYPPSRVWGVPTTAMWVLRMGAEKAKRYLLTGDEIPATKAAEIGLILEAVPRDSLDSRSLELARRMAMVPLNQLILLKLLCNQTAEHMGIASTRLIGTLFDGIARHTQEGRDFASRAAEVGFRQAVRERDDPFGDYGSG